jgi:hypothetical protein
MHYRSRGWKKENGRWRLASILQVSRRVSWRAVGAAPIGLPPGSTRSSTLGWLRRHPPLSHSSSSKRIAPASSPARGRLRGGPLGAVPRAEGLPRPRGGNYYSVPWTLVGQTVLVRTTEREVTAFAGGETVVRHARLSGAGHTITEPRHYSPTKRIATQEIHRQRLGALRSAGPHAAELVPAPGRSADLHRSTGLPRPPADDARVPIASSRPVRAPVFRRLGARADRRGLRPAAGRVQPAPGRAGVR